MNNELKNSIKYIREKSGNNTGLSVPENYFNGIEDNIFSKLSEEALPNESSFEVPNTYFDNLETEILNKVKNKELTEENTFLELSEKALPSEPSFEVPDTYFDTLEAQILDKVKLKRGKVISFKDRLIKFIPATVAASLLLFVSLQFFNTTKDLTIDDISSADIENWFDENNTYTDTELTFSFEEDINEHELTFTEVSFDDEAIEDYLNSIDNTDLLNEIQ